MLRPSTGYPLPVLDEAHGRGGRRIRLRIVRDGSLGAEGYRLDVAPTVVSLSAPRAAGLYYAVQTLRQLFPAVVESETVRPGPWTLPGVRVTDTPRFAWRGAMLDVARHFFTVEEVKRYLDLLSEYKINVLHLHLTDDQGWRIQIERWPRLATYGGSTEVGGGPSGYYTKADYAEIVRYARRHHVMIVPEIDIPGHINAALASYPELSCDDKAPPLYGGTRVGFSSLCIDKPVTYRFLDDVIGELAATTPGAYIHIGGDEAYATPHDDYVRFVNRVSRIVAAHDKTMVGWEEIAGADPPAGSIAQHWRGDAHSLTAARKNLKVLMSPAKKAYLDMKYDEDTPLGLSWAGCDGVCDSYEWDPATWVEGLPTSSLLGVEAPVWSETLEDIKDVEYMTFPRIAGIAELGWSPAEARSWSEYRHRLAAQGPRWDEQSVNYYRSPEVPWPG